MVDKNKLDGFDKIDPTQPQGENTYFDQITLSWKVKQERVTANSTSTEDVERIEALTADLENKIRLLALANSELEQVRGELSLAKENLREKTLALADANEQVAELQREIDNLPSECDILNRYIVPVRNVAGEVIFHAFQSNLGCGNESATLASLGGNELGIVQP